MKVFLASHALVLLSVQAILVITGSRMLAAVLRRLGQPMVIAEVLAGIALGPSLEANDEHEEHQASWLSSPRVPSELAGKSVAKVSGSS